MTSIVRGRECVFAKEENGCWLCMLEKAARQKAAANSQFSILNAQFIKPISCALYPIREKTFNNGLVGLNYNRWEVCRDAVLKGKAMDVRVYQFLKEPLIRRFGEAWYEELCAVANQLLHLSS